MGGKARAAKLSKHQRRDLAKKAAKARLAKGKKLAKKLAFSLAFHRWSR